MHLAAMVAVVAAPAVTESPPERCDELRTDHLVRGSHHLFVRGFDLRICYN